MRRIQKKVNCFITSGVSFQVQKKIHERRLENERLLVEGESLVRSFRKQQIQAVGKNWQQCPVVVSITVFNKQLSARVSNIAARFGLRLVPSDEAYMNAGLGPRHRTKWSDALCLYSAQLITLLNFLGFILDKKQCFINWVQYRGRQSNFRAFFEFYRTVKSYQTNFLKIQEQLLTSVARIIWAGRRTCSVEPLSQCWQIHLTSLVNSTRAGA